MKSKTAVSFTVLPENKIVGASQSESILEALLRNKIEIGHSCGGMGACTTCRIYVEKGLEKFLPQNDLESERAKERNFADNERLSCQNHVVPGMVIRKP